MTTRTVLVCPDQVIWCGRCNVLVAPTQAALDEHNATPGHLSRQPMRRPEVTA